MNKENYRILKELNSLDHSIINLKKLISEELSRITKIEKSRTKRNQELLNLEESKNSTQTELNKAEDKIFHLDKIIKKAHEQSNQVFSENEIKSLEKQKLNAEKELAEYEAKGLELLEDLTQIESAITDANSFLKGSIETINEIENEINESNAEVYSEIKIKSQRMEILMQELPPKVTDKYIKLKSKYKNTPLTHITDQNSCEICGYLIPMALLNSVETHHKFHSCPSCERILIPQASKFL